MEQTDQGLDGDYLADARIRSNTFKANNALIDEETNYWFRFKENNDQTARDALLLLHLPYARTIAAMAYAKRYGNEVEFCEYEQIASTALIECIDRFDYGRGVQFRTYAAKRMHGAILNSLTHLTERQSQIALKKRLLSERRESMKQCDDSTNLYENTFIEKLDGTNVKSRELEVFRKLANVGIGLAISWLLEETAMVERAEAQTRLQPYSGLELVQLQKKIRELVESLAKQERTVIYAHYLQEISFEDIAEMLQVSKGRIAQIHRKALLHLHSSIKYHSCDILG